MSWVMIYKVEAMSWIHSELLKTSHAPKERRMRHPRYLKVKSIKHTNWNHLSQVRPNHREINFLYWLLKISTEQSTRKRQTCFITPKWRGCLPVTAPIAFSPQPWSWRMSTITSSWRRSMCSRGSRLRLRTGQPRGRVWVPSPLSMFRRDQLSRVQLKLIRKASL